MSWTMAILRECNHAMLRQGSDFRDRYGAHHQNLAIWHLRVEFKLHNTYIKFMASSCEEVGDIRRGQFVTSRFSCWGHTQPTHNLLSNLLEPSYKWVHGDLWFSPRFLLTTLCVWLYNTYIMLICAANRQIIKYFSP